MAGLILLRPEGQALAARAVEVSARPQGEGKVAPFLLQTLGAGGSAEMIAVLVSSADLSPAGGIGDRAKRGGYVYEVLRNEALASQQPIITWLKSRGGSATRFWIVNAVLVKGDLAFADEIASRPEVERVVANPTVLGLDGFSSESGPGSLGAADRGRVDVPREGEREVAPRNSGLALSREASLTSGVGWGVAAVSADGVWTSLGVRGEGVVVASLDTGVQWDHPALKGKYRGWNGATADHSYSWHDAIEHTAVPFDDNDHGTHTTGTMTGDDGAGNQIGVAPGARWIACRNMDHGNGTPATYLECMQWALAPYPEGADPLRDGRPDLGADITNNSWGCPPSEGCDQATLREAFEKVRAAGQMTVASAGNSGPACSTVKNPPATYDSVISVGAVNSSISLVDFSSRGAVTVDGSGRLKPDMAAPGWIVRSSVRLSDYRYFSGTSMASPHAAGSIALLWSARPYLRNLLGISRCYLEQSAGPVAIPSPALCGGTAPADRPNNLSGWGMVNALAAINLSPDGDGDGIADACDCAPGAPSAFDLPPEATGDRFSAGKQSYTWGSLASLAGGGTLYDVARGLLSELKADGGFARASCRANGQTATSLQDSELPPVGNAFYYTVRGRNSCGAGPYGNQSDGRPRLLPICQ